VPTVRGVAGGGMFAGLAERDQGVEKFLDGLGFGAVKVGGDGFGGERG
jgi:hypothetical protein